MTMAISSELNFVGAAAELEFLLFDVLFRRQRHSLSASGIDGER